MLFLCLFASQAGMLVLSPILPDIAREFGVSTATAGQLRAISGATGGLVAIALAVAPRRPGLRDLLTAGAALVALGVGAERRARSASRCWPPRRRCSASASGVLVAVGVAAAGEWPEDARRPHVLAWAIAGMPAAWIAGMPVVGVVAAVHWRAAWLAVPAVVALAAVGLLRSRARRRAIAIASARRSAAWRRPDVARFTLGELLANAAWASRADVRRRAAAGELRRLAGRRRARPRRRRGRDAAGHLRRAPVRREGDADGCWPRSPLLQGGAVLLLGTVRPGVVVTLGILAAMAHLNGWRSMVASSTGMDAAPEDKLAVMAMRAAANQFGYLLGAATGGLALAVGGFPALGVALSAMFVTAVLVNRRALRASRDQRRARRIAPSRPTLAADARA